MDYQTAVKVSAGFGGGMFLGSVCGAVTGGIMALGLKYGGTGQGSNPKIYALVREFAQKFKAQHRSINCLDLTGVDITNPEIVKKMTADLSKPENLKAVQDALGGRNPMEIFAACRGYVVDAAKIVNDLVNAPA